MININLTNNLQHVAIIMDGNRRWATQKNKSFSFGYKEGLKVLKKILYFSIKIHLNILTLYVFSIENWNRPNEEVSFLMKLFYYILKDQMNVLHNKNVCVKIIGDKSRLSSIINCYINKIELLTQNNTGLRLNLAISYSGKWDILNCIKGIVLGIMNKSLYLEQIDEQVVSRYMCLNDIPPIDLVIRTGGMRRISNFFLWQIAYSELFFTNILWPDFTIKNFLFALNYFIHTKRNFGSK